MINKLIEIVGKEAELFETFLALLEQQQKHLVDNNTDGLNEVTHLQREKMVESQILNKERESLVIEIKKDNAIDGDLNISKLLDLVDKNQAERLVQLKELIVSLHDQIAEVRNQNAVLLNRSRSYISRMMNTLSKINSPAPNYSKNGTNQEQQQTISIDRRV